jgi:hypothetical protein
MKPVITYGLETWTLRKTDENSLVVYERKVLRKIYGPCLDVNTGEWRIRKNRELKEMYQNLSIVEDITKRRLFWIGHAWRKKGSLLRTVLKKVPLEKTTGMPYIKMGRQSKRRCGKSKARRGLKGIIVRKRKLEANLLDGWS